MQLSIAEIRDARGGTSAFAAFIQAVGGEATWRIAQNAMASASAPLLSEMRSRMPVGPGKTSGKTSGMTKATLAIRKSKKVPSVLVGVFAPRSHVGRFLEYGYTQRHKDGSVHHIPAHPWMPAGIGSAADDVAREIETQVAKVLR